MAGRGMRCGREGPRPGLTGLPPMGNRGQRTSLPHSHNIGDGPRQRNQLAIFSFFRSVLA